jgi:glycosyltransferase 2 family protein
MSKNTRRALFVVVQLAMSAGLLAYLLSRADVARLVSLWAGVHQPYLWLAMALQIVGVLISALKWWLLLRAAGAPVPYAWTVRTYFIGQFFSNFLPTMIGGDAVRIYYLNRRIGRPALAIASVFVERITGFLALTLIAIIALSVSSSAFSGAPELLLGVIGCVLVASAGLVVACTAPWLARLATRIPLPDTLSWRRKLRSFADSMATFYAFPGALALAMVLAFAYQFTWVAENDVAARALGLSLPLNLVALMVPISDIVGLVPLFFNGLGARESTFVLLLDRAGVASESALAVSFLIFAVRLVASLIGGILYALSGVERLRGKNIAAVAESE